MAAPYSSVQSQRYSIHRSPQRPYTRIAAYMIVSALIAVLVIVTAEAEARYVERMRESGVTTPGIVTDKGMARLGGGLPGYWVTGTFPAETLSGGTVDQPFRFDLTADDYERIATGATIPVIYDPDRRSDPKRAEEIATIDSNQLRVAAWIGGLVYLVIGAALSAADWRVRAVRERRWRRQVSAFGSR